MLEYNRGYLSDFFDGFAVKRLTSVEINPVKSNQHEFQGVQKLRQILGAHSDKVSFNASFIWLDDEEEPESLESFVTWSDVRRGNPNRSPEYHLYYSAESAPLVHKASPGDLLLVCKQKSGDLLIVIVPARSTIERQLSWLFDFELEDTVQPIVRDLAGGNDREVGFAARFILDELGLAAGQTDENFLDLLVNTFGAKFPGTAVFSAFARENLRDVSAHDDPDKVLLIWMDHEEKLFRTLEKHIVSERLKTGFYDDGGPDVDGFIRFSLSVQNRRKVRAGYALENHLEPLFVARNISYSRGAKTEQNKKPDFLFPSVEAYHDLSSPDDQLTILGAKSSCKDRWRQVLSEAARVKEKHLLTLEPGISENQTAEMAADNLQLVVPTGLHSSYTSNQQQWIYDLKRFMDLVQEKQA